MCLSVCQHEIMSGGPITRPDVAVLFNYGAVSKNCRNSENENLGLPENQAVGKALRGFGCCWERGNTPRETGEARRIKYPKLPSAYDL